MLSILWISSALASDWYLETQDRAERSDVSKWQEELLATGVDDVRLVRRFVDGEGWRFLVRADGFDAEEPATETAHTMADLLSVQVGVFRNDGGTASRVASVEPATGPTPVEAAPARDASPELSAAVAALGVDDALEAAVDGGKLLLAYRRTLADGRVVDHTWASDGKGGVYVELERVQGDVTPSRLLVSGDHAWLSVDRGPWTEQNVEKARLLADSLGPTEVVPLVLKLGDAVGTRREFERMALGTPGEFDGAPTTHLSFEGDARSGGLAIDLGEDDLPARVRFGDGDTAVVHEFRDYRSEHGRRLPTEITTIRGRATDVVSVDTLDPDADLPAEWFRTPR